MKKLGLALGGGGIKGLAHLGVLQVLEENNIPIKYVSGTSAGSIVAALWAAGYSPRAIENKYLNIRTRDYTDYDFKGMGKYLLSILLPFYKGSVNGIIAGKKIEKLIYEMTQGKKLMDIEIPLSIIACDIDTGKEVIFTNQDIEIRDPNTIIIKNALLSEAVRASISIPVTFVPKRFSGMQMVDGGIKDIVPVMIQKAMGAEYILAVNLGQESYDQGVTGLPQIISRTINIMIYETSDISQKIYADMIIFPQVTAINPEDKDGVQQIIRCGRRAMKEKVEELRRYLY